MTVEADVTLRPCIVCGEPAAGSRCPDHQLRRHRHSRKRPTGERGYGADWQRLSKSARKAQPWCLDCGATEDLQADHSPEAWARRAAGKALTLADIDVVCGPCNRRRGKARGQNVTRGMDPPPVRSDPSAPRQSLRHTPPGVSK